MLIAKQIEIDMAHRLPGHKGKCRNLHGHRYKIEVGVEDKIIKTEGASNEGMIIDFGDLKQIMMKYLDEPFDHNTIIYEKDPMIQSFLDISKEQSKEIKIVSFIPTVENLVMYWFGILENELIKVGIKIKYIKAWETPTSTAIYETI